MIRRTWVANCDAPGCDKTEFLEGDQYDGRWQIGIQISDAGWQASPNVRDTYCPEHAAEGHDDPHQDE